MIAGFSRLLGDDARRGDQVARDHAAGRGYGPLADCVMSDRDELLANMSHEEAREVPDLQPHRRHRHSLMNTEFVALSEKLSVASI